MEFRQTLRFFPRRISRISTNDKKIRRPRVRNRIRTRRYEPEENSSICFGNDNQHVYSSNPANRQDTQRNASQKEPSHFFGTSSCRFFDACKTTE